MAHTHLEPGEYLEISERAYLYSSQAKQTNISALVVKSPEELRQLEKSSVEREQALYESICELASEWVQQAKGTIVLRKAQEYLTTPAVDHTFNQWSEKEYGWHELSNMVYKMRYRFFEEQNYRFSKKTAPTYYELSWYLTFNTTQNPDFSGNGKQIAGQTQKRFDDKASMEKYLQGRIKAYSHLFTEISPPIPEEHKKRFFVNGVLLPGYTVESPELLAPDKEAVDDLLSLLSDEDIGGEALEAPPDPQPEEKTPESIWSRNRQKRQGASKPKQAPTR